MMPVPDYDPDNDPRIDAPKSTVCVSCGEPLRGIDMDIIPGRPFTLTYRDGWEYILKEQAFYCPVCAPMYPVCRECGCTNFAACPGSCHWVEEDLCSACVGKSILAATATLFGSEPEASDFTPPASSGSPGCFTH